MRRKSTIQEMQELYNKKEAERDKIHERQKKDSYLLKLVNNRLTNIRHKIKQIKTIDCQSKV